jgi:cytoskeletal protein CcmA (bactofilin family)
VKGEITGAEDVVVEGIVEGGINLKQNTVSIGRSGRVMASIHAKVIHVEGEVTGDLFACDAVVVHKTGSVRGNINSPRVTLEDGSRLKGSIDTEVASVEVKLSSTDGNVKNASANNNNSNNNKKAEPQANGTANQGAALQ